MAGIDLSGSRKLGELPCMVRQGMWLLLAPREEHLLVGDEPAFV